MDDFIKFWLGLFVIILLLGSIIAFSVISNGNRCKSNGGAWSWADGGCFKKVDGKYMKGNFVKLHNQWVFIQK